MSQTHSTCHNPRCSCDPCRCGHCECGAVRLGTLEQQIMDQFWGSGSPDVTVRSIANACPGYAYTTIATVLDRLVAKGILRSRFDGRVKRYTAVGSRERHTAVLMHDALSADRDPAGALRHFVENLSETEAEIVRKALHAFRGPRTPKPAA